MKPETTGTREGDSSRPGVVVRLVRPEEADAAGRLVAAAFAAVPGAHMNGGYAEELADVSARMSRSDVLVAVGDGEVVGCVTFVPDGESPLAEGLEDGECQIRMMAVASEARGRGVGHRLVGACVERARELGRRAVFLHSTPAMTAAHRLYLRNGFVRVPQRDWVPEPDLTLIAFRLELAAR